MTTPGPPAAAVIGAGPAGLAAAEVMAAAGLAVTLYEARPSVARKFLMAGKSGLNLTRDEPADRFARTIGCARLDPILEGFGPAEAMAWAEGLGEPLFTGSSGRVFPRSMKGSPLLRRWLAWLDAAGAAVRTRWRWTGWEGPALAFQTPDGPALVRPAVTVLALGGASWPRLGSDGAWVGPLGAAGVAVQPFRPANMGFDVAWSDHIAQRYAGAPVKPAALVLGAVRVRGEFVVTRTGIEGSAVYAVAAPLRDALEAGGADLRLDLLPDLDTATAALRLGRARGKGSWSNHLRKTLGLDGIRAALLRELAPGAGRDPDAVAAAAKALPVPVTAARPLAEAISSAGGIAWPEVDAALMLRARPGTFVAGEMLDWEAPTGGYLLTACLATGRHAGRNAAEWAQAQPAPV